MPLVDHQIQAAQNSGELTITPWNQQQLQPASYDLTLADLFAQQFGDGWYRDYDPDGRDIYPGEFLLASTVETIRLGPTIAGQVEGKSTWARRGLQIHAAGFVDPGFQGQITLELFNMSPWPIQLTPGVLIAQIKLEQLSAKPHKLYGDPTLKSHYQNQEGPTPPCS